MVICDMKYDILWLKHNSIPQVGIKMEDFQFTFNLMSSGNSQKKVELTNICKKNQISTPASQLIYILWK